MWYHDSTLVWHRTWITGNMKVRISEVEGKRWAGDRLGPNGFDSGCGIPLQNIGSWGMYLHTTFWKKVEDRPINQKSRRYRAFANVQLQLLLWTNVQRWDTKSRNTNSCSGSLLRISRISKYHVTIYGFRKPTCNTVVWPLKLNWDISIGKMFNRFRKKTLPEFL